MRGWSYDRVLCIAVLHHISNPDRPKGILEEVGRGLITVWAENQETPEKSLAKLTLIGKDANKGGNCKGLRNEGNKFELDESALKLFNSDVQTFFDCCPSNSVVDFSIPELQLDGVIEITKPVTVQGGGASIKCSIDSKNEGALVIRLR
ncbi:hypothetical protein BSKO_07048 [Bryopsis sp. KO-2023]|nr:hypothetical protein BSKO_07048 [Bryopsis sp. KO-2023]